MKTYVKEIEGYIVPAGATHYTKGVSNPINAFYKRLGSAIFYSHSIRHDWLLEKVVVNIPENSIELPLEDTVGILKKSLLSENEILHKENKSLKGQLDYTYDAYNESRFDNSKEILELKATLALAHSDLATFRNDMWHAIKPRPDTKEAEILEVIGTIMDNIEIPEYTLSSIKADAVIEAARELFTCAKDSDYRYILEGYAVELRNKHARSQ
jgi:hypothetical protein